LETEWQAAGLDKAVNFLTGTGMAFMLLLEPKNRPAEVRASVVATKRVMTEERRDAGKWKRESTSNRNHTGESGSDGRKPAIA
jgi:hypothetical protein